MAANSDRHKIQAQSLSRERMPASLCPFSAPISLDNNKARVYKEDVYVGHGGIGIPWEKGQSTAGGSGIPDRKGLLRQKRKEEPTDRGLPEATEHANNPQRVICFHVVSGCALSRPHM